MEKIYAVEDVRVSIGRRAESMVRCVAFDISEWAELYGGGTPQLLHQRCGDEHPYPCAIEISGQEVVWNITGADTALVGVGRAELQYFVGDQLVKSVIYETEVAQALDTTDPIVPAPEAGWVAQVLAAGAQVVGTAAKAEASANDSAASARYAGDMKGQAEKAANDAWSAAGTAQVQARASAQSAQLSRGYAEQAAKEAAKAVQKAYVEGLFTGAQGDKGDRGEPFTYEDFTDEQLGALVQSVTANVLTSANICYVSVSTPVSGVGRDGDICVVVG